ncbi:MAG: hypothetical protein LAP21_15175 [Acidobacteriia bacterium]|nr:hypothetical protein [Terriglobia bacterium]
MAQPCKFCQGKGAVQYAQGQPPVTCPVCGGSGTQEDPGQFFVYELTFALTANQANVQTSLNILNRNFKWMFALAQSTGAFATQLSDGSTQRQFSNQQVHVNNLFGTAQNPFPLLSPYMFKQKGQIQAISTDLSGAPNNVRLAFAGVEIDA